MGAGTWLSDDKSPRCHRDFVGTDGQESWLSSLVVGRLWVGR